MVTFLGEEGWLHFWGGWLHTPKVLFMLKPLELQIHSQLFQELRMKNAQRSNGQKTFRVAQSGFRLYKIYRRPKNSSVPGSLFSHNPSKISSVLGCRTVTILSFIQFFVAEHWFLFPAFFCCWSTSHCPQFIPVFGCRADISSSKLEEAASLSDRTDSHHSSVPSIF